MILASSTILSTFVLSVSAVQYKLAQNYSGSTFFDRWIFQNGIDANTTGNVLYQTQQQAQDLKLIGTNNAGNVIIKVDNTTSGANDPTFGRPSVKILSQDTMEAGSLLIFDAVHMPYGCSVWPAFWTQGSTWPDGGEIDIVENVNLATNNRMALHTTQGCQHPPAGQVQETGKLVQADCFNQTNGNVGCLIQDNNGNSFGAPFAQNGGGVFATLWDDQGIRIWFFPRSTVPADAGTPNPDPTKWGTPTAFYSSSTCDFQKFFAPQTIIFDISVCGNFAGLPQVFNPTCQGKCTDLVQTPSNYDNAYFEIRYLALFTNGTSTTTASGIVPPPSGTGSGPKPTTTGKGNGTLPVERTGIFTLLIALALSVVFAAAISFH